MENMSCEILDALESYYKADITTISKCLVWILNKESADDWPLYDWLNSHNLCARCGAPMVMEPYKELHTEVDTMQYETMYEAYCPNCYKEDAR